MWQANKKGKSNTMRIYSILLLYPDVTYLQTLGATEHNQLQQSNDRPPFRYTAEKEDKASSTAGTPHLLHVRPQGSNSLHSGVFTALYLFSSNPKGSYFVGT